MPTATPATQLMRLARPLQPARPPYYLHSPGIHPAEQAPGWYIVLDAHPVYIGAQFVDALRRIDALLAQKAPA